MKIFNLCIFILMTSFGLFGQSQYINQEIALKKSKIQNPKSDTYISYDKVYTDISLDRPHLNIVIDLSNVKNQSSGFDMRSLEIRYSSNGLQWSTYRQVTIDDHDQGIYAMNKSELLFADANTRYIQLRSKTLIKGIKLLLSSPPIIEPIDNSRNHFSQRDGCPLGSFQGRLDWCPSGDCNPPQGVFTEVTHLIVHHSAGVSTSTNWPSVVRSIWNYHVNTKNWDDIGYNWLIDPNGVIYEGRPDNIRGAHMCGHNTGTMGICLLGNFEQTNASEKMIQSLKKLLAWKADNKTLDPISTIYHPSSDKQLKTISGHKDGCSPGYTQCPGANFYPLLPQIRTGVKSLMADCQNPPSNIDEDYKIGTWRGFTKTAVSYTWDDNTPNQLAVAKPLFDQYGFKTTFFVVSNWVDDWSAFQSAVDEGHEVGSHTMTHLDLSKLESTKVLQQLTESKTKINNNISGEQCVSLAYPFCESTVDTVVAKHYISARICSGEIEKSTPKNMMRVSAISCGSEGSIKTSIQFNKKVKAAIKSKGWVVFLLHGINNDGGYSNIQSTVLNEHLEHMDSLREDYWVSTYGQTAKYIRERDESSITESFNTNNSVITIHLENDLNPDIYDEPLSIQRLMPDNWDTLLITQNQDTIDYQIVRSTFLSYIRFNAVPNAGDIIMTSLSMVNTPALTPHIDDYKLYPNPSEGNTTLSFNIKTPMDITITIVDELGRLLSTERKEHYMIGKHQIEINTKQWRRQIVYCVIQSDGNRITKKLLVK